MSLAPLSPGAPIAVFAYRRLEHLSATIGSLARNPEADRSPLVIFCDGAKGERDRSDVAAVRAYAAQVMGFASLEVVERPHNFGLAASIIDGVTTMLARHSCVIVVEDDLLVSPHFLAYMNDGLERYAEDARVASIHAYIYPLTRPVPETFFLRGADCWGWATWRRAWRHFNPDGKALLAQLQVRSLTQAFDYDGTASFTEMLSGQIAGHNNSWAIRWHAACFLDGLLTLYPGHSLVHNIGNDGSGTHRGADTGGRFGRAVAAAPVTVAPIPVMESAAAREAVADYFRHTRPGGLRRGLQRFRQLFRTRFMTPYRLARRLCGTLLRMIPWTRRHVMMMPDYKVISLEAAQQAQKIAWHNPRAAALQDKAYLDLLDAMHAGSPRIDLRIAAQAVDAAGLDAASLLEVGCGSGYYSEILQALAATKVDYCGLDYSAAMVEKAKARHPHVRFETGDATALRFADATFDIVFNGVSLMHILDYRAAIAESARVARAAVIFHSVPVFRDHPTTFLRKYAYGGLLVEAVFNRDEFLGLCARNGLTLAQSWPTIPYDVGHVTGAPSYAETFLFSRKRTDIDVLDAMDSPA